MGGVDLFPQNVFRLNHGGDEVSDFDWFANISVLGFNPYLMGYFIVKFIGASVVPCDIVEGSFDFILGDLPVFGQSLVIELPHYPLV